MSQEKGQQPLKKLFSADALKKYTQFATVAALLCIALFAMVLLILNAIQFHDVSTAKQKPAYIGKLVAVMQAIGVEQAWGAAAMHAPHQDLSDLFITAMATTDEAMQIAQKDEMATRDVAGINLGLSRSFVPRVVLPPPASAPVLTPLAFRTYPYSYGNASNTLFREALVNLNYAASDRQRIYLALVCATQESARLKMLLPLFEHLSVSPTGWKNWRLIQTFFSAMEFPECSPSMLPAAHSQPFAEATRRVKDFLEGELRRAGIHLNFTALLVTEEEVPLPTQDYSFVERNIRLSVEGLGADGSNNVRSTRPSKEFIAQRVASYAQISSYLRSKAEAEWQRAFDERLQVVILSIVVMIVTGVAAIVSAMQTQRHLAHLKARSAIRTNFAGLEHNQKILIRYQQMFATVNASGADSKDGSNTRGSNVGADGGAPGVGVQLNQPESTDGDSGGDVDEMEAGSAAEQTTSIFLKLVRTLRMLRLHFAQTCFGDVEVVNNANSKAAKGMLNLDLHTPEQAIAQLQLRDLRTDLGLQLVNGVVMHLSMLPFAGKIKWRLAGCDASSDEEGSDDEDGPRYNIDYMSPKISEFIALVEQAINGNQGVIHTISGDCIVALWNVVGSTPHPYYSATKAALVINKGFEEMQKKNALQGLPADSAVSIGIACSSLMAGNVEFKRRRKDLVVLGQAMAWAERYEGLNAAHRTHVMIDAEVAENISKSSFEEFGDITVRPVAILGEREKLEGETVAYAVQRFRMRADKLKNWEMAFKSIQKHYVKKEYNDALKVVTTLADTQPTTTKRSSATDYSLLWWKSHLENLLASVKSARTRHDSRVSSGIGRDLPPMMST